MDKATQYALGGAAVIGALVGLGVAVSKARGATPPGPFTLSATPASGNSLTLFTFQGTIQGTATGTAVAIFDSTGKQWGSSSVTTDVQGDYEIQVSGFTPGTYKLEARSGSAASNQVTISVSSSPPPTLTIQPSFGTILVEPDGSEIVNLGVSVTGGELPYSFTALWSDGGTQTDDTGVFSRTFSPNQAPVTSANISVISSDGQHAGPVTVTAST